MPDLSHEELADWQPLAQAVQQICLAKGCHPEKAHGEIMGGLAAGRLCARWDDQTDPPAPGDSHHPPRGDPRWISAEINWNIGTVADEFERLVTERSRARHRRLLINSVTLDALLKARPLALPPKSTEEIAADERSRLAREQYADREFKKPGWSKWRVYAWIAYRYPRLICKIEDQHGLIALALYSDTPSPAETLLQALQDGRLKALDRQGKEIPVDFWLSKEAWEIGDVTFRREDVLELWPVSGSEQAIEEQPRPTRSRHEEEHFSRDADAPGADRPRPQGSNLAAVAWPIALKILDNDVTRPHRGYGRLSAVARLINAELNQGHKDDSVRKAIGPSLREWERQHPQR